jgi:DNA-binding protein HU-beta
MNKTELVDHIAAKAEMTKKDASEVIDAVFESIESALSQGDKVQIVGFGSFEVRDRAARTGRNPQTGHAMEIQARRVPVFKAGKTLWDAVGQ